MGGLQILGRLQQETEKSRIRTEVQTDVRKGGGQLDCIELLEGLIAIDTTNPPGNEIAAARYLASVLEPYGFICEVQDLGDNRANLSAVIGHTDGPELMLNGHLDVVPAAGEWRTDPFQMNEIGDRLYGRGTADMKGGIAAMCEAAIRVAQKGGPGRGRLKLLFVADEECSNLGTLRYLEEHASSQYAIIGEPTDLQVAIAHRGVSRDYIDIHGAARHAALPASDSDSVFRVVTAMTAVQEINRKLQEMEHEVLPPPSISVTMIQGYEKDNIVPGTIRLLLDFRILPGMDHEQVEEILEEGFRNAGLEDFDKTLHFYMPGGEISSKDDFVSTCMEVRNGLLGGQASPCAFDASCEQCFLAERGTKAIICGPGKLAQAHTVGEYTSKAQVRQAADLYEQMIECILG